MRRKTGFPTVVMICWVDMVDTRGPGTNKQFAKFPVDMAYTAFCGPANNQPMSRCFRLSWHVMTLMWHLSTIHHVGCGAVSSVQGLAPASLEVHFAPGAKGDADTDRVSIPAVPPEVPTTPPLAPKKTSPNGTPSKLRWSRPSKASPELRPWRCRQRRHLRRSFQLFQQQLRRRWPPNQVGAPNAGALVDFDAGNDGHGMARVVILFEVQDRALFALLLKQSKLWRTYMVRVNSRKSRTLWVTLGNFGHCTVFIGRLSEDSNLPSTPRSFTCVFFCRLLLPYG